MFVCGPTGFVEAVAEALVELGHDPATDQDRALRSDGRYGMIEERRLDGNALAGALAELLVPELTAARGRCARLRRGRRGGRSTRLCRPQAPGVVLRCSHCESLLAVVVQRNGSTRFVFSGLVWIET